MQPGSATPRLLSGIGNPPGGSGSLAPAAVAAGGQSFASHPAFARLKTPLLEFSLAATPRELYSLLFEGPAVYDKLGKKHVGG